MIKDIVAVIVMAITAAVMFVGLPLLVIFAVR